MIADALNSFWMSIWAGIRTCVHHAHMTDPISSLSSDGPTQFRLLLWDFARKQGNVVSMVYRPQTNHLGKTLPEEIYVPKYFPLDPQERTPVPYGET